jgi:hypothetical protein
VVASWEASETADAAAQALGAALWCATVDTALRIAVSYAQERSLYGGTVWEIPHARSLVADACADLLTADAIATAGFAAADIGALPLVPALLGDCMRALSVLFGSTFFARVEPYAVFETFVRDLAAMRLVSTRVAAPESAAAQHEAAAAVVQSAGGGPELWRSAASTRLELRAIKRRGVLGDDAIEALASHVAGCTARGISIMPDGVGVFAPPKERKNP